MFNNNNRLPAAVLFSLALGAPLGAVAADAPYDLVIRNARVVDGTGYPWFRSDVAVRGDTIVAVAPSITGPAKRVIDAKGLVVSPGFIDVHTHAGRTIFQVPTADNYIRQGVTLIMEGADGAGPSMAGSAPTPLNEIVELQKVVAPFRGLHTSDMRDEAAGVVDAVKEAIAIGELGGVPTQVSHHKMIGQKNWGRSVETLKLIDAARARGVDATLDQYPYTASSTSIQAALLPKYALEGGLKATIARLKDPAMRPRIKADVARIIQDERGGGDPRNVAVSLCEWDATLGGKNLADISVLRGLPPAVESAAEVTLWLVENGGCGGVFHAIGEEDVVRVMAHPATMIASDGQVVQFGVGVPHPRSYGTFARVLGV